MVVGGVQQMTACLVISHPLALVHIGLSERKHRGIVDARISGVGALIH